MEDLRYPIGKFVYNPEHASENKAVWISELAAAPSQFRSAVHGLSSAQLDTPYRPGGWSIRQVIHHVPDSHMNSYIRFKLALTEDNPTIKTYHEDAWAELPDSVQTPVETSLQLLESLHERWVNLLLNMTDADFARTLHHPEMGRIPLLVQLAIYAWHSKHHLAHITELKKREGW